MAETKQKPGPTKGRVKSQIQFTVSKLKRSRCGSKHPDQSQTAAALERPCCLPAWFWLCSDQRKTNRISNWPAQAGTLLSHTHTHNQCPHSDIVRCFLKREMSLFHPAILDVFAIRLVRYSNSFFAESVDTTDQDTACLASTGAMRLEHRTNKKLIKLGPEWLNGNQADLLYRLYLKRKCADFIYEIIQL